MGSWVELCCQLKTFIQVFRRRLQLLWIPYTLGLDTLLGSADVAVVMATWEKFPGLNVNFISYEQTLSSYHLSFPVL